MRFMPQIRKILFPVDFSESCFGAARYVEAFAGQFEAEIMLLHVVSMGEHNLPEQLLPSRKAQLDQFLAGELKYFTTHRVCKAGDPSVEIVEASRAWAPDLVMMPTHGLGFFRRHLLGSVTAKALHDLDCPLWTSVHAETAPRLEHIHCRRILCCLDFTEDSRNILEWASWLAREYQAQLAIAHATAAMNTGEAGWYPGDDFEKQFTEQALARIALLQQEVGSTAEQVFVRAGKPDLVAATAAREFEADLVVIGRHGEAGIAGNLFQHAYAILRESPCPVISI
jgi:nucleotide-binding universal stress UspA family protein